MNPTNFIIRAQEIARTTHAGQTDKAGVDYFEGHLTSVAAMGKTWQEKVVGYLHDVAEDTPTTEEEVMKLLQQDEKLQESDTREIEEALCLMNSNRYPDRESYLKGITKNQLALRVKLNDLTNNMDLTRIANPTEKDFARIERYKKEIEILRMSLDDSRKNPNNSSLDLSSDTKLLRDRYSKLKKEFSEVFAQKEHMLSHEQPLLTALYLQKIGQKKYEAYCLNVELAKLKHRLALLQAFVNRNEKPDLKAVDKEIEVQFAEYQQKIEAEAQRLAAAQDFLKSSFFSSEDVKKIKEIYYIIVKRLHPDINPDLPESMKELFVKAQTAYELGDLVTLQQILLLLNNDNSDLEIALPNLKEMVSRLQENVKTLKHQIELLNLEFPFIFREKLEDEEWIETERETTDQEIETLKQEIEKYKNYVTLLEEWKPE